MCAMPPKRSGVRKPSFDKSTTPPAAAIFAAHSLRLPGSFIGDVDVNDGSEINDADVLITGSTLKRFASLDASVTASLLAGGIASGARLDALASAIAKNGANRVASDARRVWGTKLGDPYRYCSDSARDPDSRSRTTSFTCILKSKRPYIAVRPRPAAQHTFTLINTHIKTQWPRPPVPGILIGCYVRHRSGRRHQ